MIVDPSCVFAKTCGHDPCPSLQGCPDGRPVPLFLPLARRWYLEVRDGTKRTEYRPAGILIDKNGKARRSPWNASTCRVGRPAIIGNGYQTPDRLQAVVVRFQEQPDADDTTAAFDAIYPGHRARGGLVAAIFFRLLDDNEARLGFLGEWLQNPPKENA